MLLKQTNTSLSKNRGSWDFWQIANSVFIKGKSLIPPLFKGPEILPSASDKENYLPKRTKNSHLNDSGISLPAFPSRTKMKLHNN